MIIYHITSRQEWSDQKTKSNYVPSGYAQFGFIHCSTEAQVWPVANNLFFGVRDLVVLQIDTNKLDVQPIFENLEGGSDLFPHLYHPLPTSAVTKVIEFYIGPDLS